jgi:hypothetical protein
VGIVALTAIAGVVVLVQDRGSITTAERAARRRNLLPAFRGDDVSEVKLTVQGKAARALRGPADALGQRPWKVEIDGAVWPAEEPAIDQLLAALRDGVVDRWIQGEAPQAGEPRAMIAVEMGKQRYRVTVRGAAPTPPGAVYVEVEGGDAPAFGVITAQLAAVLLAPPERLRQKALVQASPTDLATIAIDGEGGPRHLERAPWPAPRGAGFRFDGSTPEGRARASAVGLDRVWEGLAKLSADAFLADADADRALDRKVTVTLGAKAGGRVTVDLGGACPGHPDDVVAVRREGSARVSACVARAALELLSVPAQELLDLHLFGARAEDVADLKIAVGSAPPIAMARRAAQWHEQAPTDRMIDAEVGKAFAERLLDATARKLSGGDLRALGLDPPRATVRVVSLAAGGGDAGEVERTEIVEVGAEQGGVVHVRRQEDGMIGEVAADAAAPLLADEMALRPRRVWDLSGARFLSLRLESPGRVQRLEREADGHWALREPTAPGLVADGAGIGEITEALGRLTVDRWVGPRRPEHGLERPRFRLHAEIEEAARDGGKGRRGLDLDIGAPEGGGGSFARAGEEPDTVFVLPRRLEEAASRWLVDRTALALEMSHVSRIVLRAPGGKKLTLEAIGGVFQVHGAASDPVANARAAAVREALADFSAEAAVTIGRPDKSEGFDKPALEIEAILDGKPVRMTVGAGDAREGVRVYYVRREGIDATYVVAQAKVRALMDAVAGGN